MNLRKEFSYYLDGKPVYEAVYELLRDAIVVGHIAPGERLFELHYAQLLNVSRTPVRTAFRRLVNNGLAAELPKGGVEAKGVDISSLDNIFRFQQSLERLAFPQAMNNITEEELMELFDCIRRCEEQVDQDIHEVSHLNEQIHRELFRISRFEGIMQAVDLAYGFVHVFNILSARDIDRQKEITSEHKAILKALRDKDQMLMESAADYHLESSKHYAIKRMLHNDQIKK